MREIKRRNAASLGLWVSAFILLAFQAPTYSLVKGTVFTPEGRSFQGAKIVLDRADVEEKQRNKLRKEGLSDRLGEFAFRVPPGPAKYELTVEAKGFQTQEREIEILGDERVDVSIVLKK